MVSKKTSASASRRRLNKYETASIEKLEACDTNLDTNYEIDCGFVCNI